MSKNIHKASAELACARKHIQDITGLETIGEMQIRDDEMYYAIMVWDENKDNFKYCTCSKSTVRSAVADIKKQIKSKEL